MNDVSLPALNNFMDIDPFQVQAFRKNGHTLVREVMTTEEMNVYRNVINDAAYKYNTEKRKMEERDTYGKAFLQIMNLWARDEAVKIRFKGRHNKLHVAS